MKTILVRGTGIVLIPTMSPKFFEAAGRYDQLVDERSAETTLVPG
jgi:hypothetical protein